MEKIEKLKHITVACKESDADIFRFLVRNMGKINEIIDRLNEQPEEEYRYLNGDKPIKDKETIEFMEGLPDRVWEDTPEEKPEINKIARVVFKHLLGNKIDEGSELYEIGKDMIKELEQLLEEREREVFTKEELELIEDLLMFDRYLPTEVGANRVDGQIKESIMRKLDKLKQEEDV